MNDKSTKLFEITEVFDIKIKGEATSNLSNYSLQVLRAIDEFSKKELNTDDDYAEAEEFVKLCKSQEKSLADAKEQATKDSASIGEVFDAIDKASNILRDARLATEKK